MTRTIPLANVLATRKNWNGSGLSTLKTFAQRVRRIGVFPVTCFVFPYAKELYPTSLLKQVIEEVLRSFQTIGVRLVRVLELLKVLAVDTLPCFVFFYVKERLAVPFRASHR